MRYRRVSYRYTMTMHRHTTWPLIPGRGDLLGLGLGEDRWRPAADVCESRSRIDVLVDLAGIDDDQLDVQLFDDALVIEGRRHLPSCGEGAVYHAARVLQGPFRLEVPLPAAVDAGRVEARYERGILHVALPKSEGIG